MSVPQRPIHVMLMLFVITRQDPIIVPVIVGILGMDKRALVNIIHLMSDPRETVLFYCSYMYIITRMPYIGLYSQR